MINSIITCLRNRSKCLKVFLHSLSLSNNKNNFEIVITDLNSVDNPKTIINKYSSVLNIKYIQKKYNGPFWKTKALNCSFINSSGEYISMFDIDSVFTCSFIDWISNNCYKHKKICYRVKFLDINTSYNLFNRDFKCIDINNIVKQNNKFITAKERFYINNGISSKIEEYNLSHNTVYDELMLGNSHYTINRSLFEKLGGYDEDFKGYGLEDMDFNYRLWKLINYGHMNTNPNNYIYHVSHNIDNNWHIPKLRDVNREKYRYNKDNGIISVNNINFGEF